MNNAPSDSLIRMPGGLPPPEGHSWDEPGMIDWIEREGSPWAWAGSRFWPSAEHASEMFALFSPSFAFPQRSMSPQELQHYSALCLDQGRLTGSLSRPDYHFPTGEAAASLIAPRPAPIALLAHRLDQSDLLAPARNELERSMDAATLMFQRARAQLSLDPLAVFAPFALPLARAQEWIENSAALIEERRRLFAARAEARALLQSAAPAHPRPARPGL